MLVTDQSPRSVTEKKLSSSSFNCKSRMGRNARFIILTNLALKRKTEGFSWQDLWHKAPGFSCHHSSGKYLVAFTSLKNLTLEALRTADSSLCGMPPIGMISEEEKPGQVEMQDSGQNQGLLMISSAL